MFSFCSYPKKMSDKKNKTKTAKYTPLTFFPLNLYRQFSKYSNVFFLITLILLLIPTISPFPPYAYLTAFIIVVGISILKDGIEDFIRYRSDKKANERIIHKVVCDRNTEGFNIFEDKNKNLTISSTFVEDLDVNDVIVLKDNEEVPADIILLNSKINNGKTVKCRSFCYIETSSLDGETNLKKKQSNLYTETEVCRSTFEENQLFLCNCDRKIMEDLNSIDVSPGGTEFRDISALLRINHKNMLQSERNIVLRGTQVRSTTMILGLVVAVGEDTKIAKNQHQTGLKRSKFEKKVERKMFYIFILYFITLIISCVILTLNLRTEQTDLFQIEQLSSKGLQLTGTNYILYSYLIPLSLFVMIEIARVFQKAFIRFDQDIQGAYCRNSNVTEDIGLIDLVLSDKTGTLTENKMNFTFFDVGNGIQRVQELNVDESLPFVLNLLCNNGLQIVNHQYEGISQDEIALVDKIKNIGCHLIKKEDVLLKLQIGSYFITANVLATLEFTSARQRMSTVIQIEKSNCKLLPEKTIYLLMKGSDQKLKENIAEIPAEVDPNYRSLLMIHKKIEMNDKFTNFIEEYSDNLLNSEKIERLFDQIEKDMSFSGIAYIEDKIALKAQETISNLREANIKFWMVTGDKKETAMSCARSVGMTDAQACTPDEILNQIKNNPRSDINREYWMSNLPNFLIIYRTIPDKKAALAKCLVERGLSVLAIGDGNNDVSMINVATVGVGIKGKEGGQASLAGDFSLMTFHHLSKLIFYHGRNNLIRFSKLTINSFFKNVFLISFQFNFNFATGFSGLSIYNYYFVNYFNVLYTAFIPFSVAVFDKGKDANHFMDVTAQNKIIKTYHENRHFFSGTTILSSILFAATKGTILYWMSYFILDWNYIFSTIYFSWVVFLSTFLFQTYLIEFFNFFTCLSVFLTCCTFLFSIFVLNRSGYEIYGSLTFYIALFTIMTMNIALDQIFFKISKKYKSRLF